MFKEAKVQEESVLGMGCLAAILHIALFFVTGTISYNLVEPQSFLGVLLFLIAPCVRIVVTPNNQVKGGNKEQRCPDTVKRENKLY